MPNRLFLRFHCQYDLSYNNVYFALESRAGRTTLFAINRQCGLSTGWYVEYGKDYGVQDYTNLLSDAFCDRGQTIPARSVSSAKIRSSAPFSHLKSKLGSFVVAPWASGGGPIPSIDRQIVTTVFPNQPSTGMTPKNGTIIIIKSNSTSIATNRTSTELRKRTSQPFVSTLPPPWAHAQMRVVPRRPTDATGRINSKPAVVVKKDVVPIRHPIEQMHW